MKILVTGGTGVIGAGLIPELLNRAHSIVLLSRHAGKTTRSCGPSIEAFSADVTDAARLNGAASGCGAVIHIAGIAEETPPDATFQKVNVDGTRHILEEAERAGARRFVFVSSLGADRGQSAYHKSKLAAEQLVRASATDWTIVRPGNVYGPGDEVISKLLKLVRALPAMPLVGAGNQRFQPIWFSDFGKVLAELPDSSNHKKKTLEVAGEEITTMRDVISALGDITGRSTVPVPLPEKLVAAAVQAVEKFESLESLLERAGLAMPLSSAKLQMLLEENYIREANGNALQELGVQGTSLREGLRQLANELPELLPDEGVGSMERKRFEANITGSRYNARELMRVVREKITDLMPIEFGAEPGSSRRVTPGATMTGSIPGRGHLQVRVVEVTPTETTFVTVEGHPLAGRLVFQTDDGAKDHVSFAVQVDARAANVLDWLALRTIGSQMQTANWQRLVERVTELSGGSAPEGVRTSTGILSEEEAAKVAQETEEMTEKAA